MPRASVQPTASQSRRPWYRLHASSCIAGAVVAAALVLAVVPGHVTSRGAVARHGWPRTYLTQFNRWAWLDSEPKLTAWRLPLFEEREQDDTSIVVNFRSGALAFDVAVSLLILIGAMAALERSRRRRDRAVQFSLRSLLVCMLLAACGCGWWRQLEHECREQKIAAAALQKLDANVSMSPALPSWLLELTNNETVQRYQHVAEVGFFVDKHCGSGFVGCVARNSAIDDEALAPLGCLEFARRIQLGYTGLTDRGMNAFSRMRRLESLVLERTKITDAGLTHLTNLPSLWELDLRGTAITDAGLAHLAKIRSLKYVFLDGTQVTSEGMRKLKQALPSLKTTSLDDKLDLEDFSPF